MEQYILQQSQQHFKQAEGSIPTIPPMLHVLGDGHNKKCDAILDGTYTAPSSLPSEQNVPQVHLKKQQKHRY